MYDIVYMDVVILKSDRKDKKYKAVINGTKTIHFGQAGASDYTKHNDPKRRELYITRHQKEDWSISNIASPAFMSRWILWEHTTLQGAIDALNKKYKNVSFTFKE